MARNEKKPKRARREPEPEEELEDLDANEDEAVLPENQAGPHEVVSLDVDEAPRESLYFDEETTRDLLEQAQEERYEMDIAETTPDRDIQDALAERQDLGDVPSEVIEEEEEHTALSPELSGGDVDAAWTQANVAGDEAVGGTAPTPDQDRVDELGDAMGITYADDEELNTAEKLRQRDEHRWELDPDSLEEEEAAEQFEDEEDEEEEAYE